MSWLDNGSMRHFCAPRSTGSAWRRPITAQAYLVDLNQGCLTTSDERSWTRCAVTFSVNGGLKYTLLIDLSEFWLMECCVEETRTENREGPELSFHLTWALVVLCNLSPPELVMSWAPSTLFHSERPNRGSQIYDPASLEIKSKYSWIPHRPLLFIVMGQTCMETGSTFLFMVMGQTWMETGVPFCS